MISNLSTDVCKQPEVIDMNILSIEMEIYEM
jgi:hypothetical protein